MHFWNLFAVDLMFIVEILLDTINLLEVCLAFGFIEICSSNMNGVVKTHFVSLQ